jgi:NAD(P)-dependent dehydrogenase (short-subunit alcohol dehydrogenase family)
MQTIVITGVSLGIGRALALEWVRMGHRVHGCARSAEKLEELERMGVHTAVVDVCDRESVEAWALKVMKAEGTPPDFLINNAAIINPNACFVDVLAEDFDRVIDVNVKGVANVTRAFLPPMLKRRHGVVVNLSSGWGRSTSPEVVPYCCSKWAIEGFTRALAQELPSGMAAIPLSPNTVNTRMLQSCFGAASESSPLPDDWAEVVAPWLLTLGPKDNGRPLSTPR